METLTGQRQTLTGSDHMQMHTYDPPAASFPHLLAITLRHSAPLEGYEINPPSNKPPPQSSVEG